MFADGARSISFSGIRYNDTHWQWPVLPPVALRFAASKHSVRLETEPLDGPSMRSFNHAKIGEALVLETEPVWRS
jgi:hypothetical protein